MRGFFDWIVKDPEVLIIVDEEFAMYKHHLREKSGQDNLGWLRIMIHTWVQPVVRQSPAYCVLYVPFWGNHNYILNSYPYYAKFQEAKLRSGLPLT